MTTFTVIPGGQADQPIYAKVYVSVSPVQAIALMDACKRMAKAYSNLSPDDGYNSLAANAYAQLAAIVERQLPHPVEG